MAMERRDSDLSNLGPIKPLLPWNVYGYTILASLSSFVYGYNTGIIAPAIIFIPKSIPLTTAELSAIISIILIGAMIGSFLSGVVADYFGRRRVITWNNWMMIFAALLAAFGVESAALIVSRFLLGLGVGVASVVPGLYITEIAPPHIRGKLGAINQLLGWSGIIVSYFVGYGVAKENFLEQLSWRVMFASGTILCIFHWLISMALLPETPRWLVHSGKNEAAIDVLKRIYGDEHQAHIVQQFQLLQERKEHREPLCLSIEEIFDLKYRKPLVIAVVLQFLQQLSGNSVIVYYSTIIFHEMGYDNADALLYNAIACIPQFLVLMSVVFTLDSHGRKPALLVSEVGIAISLVIMAVATSMASADASQGRFYLLLGGIILHRCFFSSGMGPVPTVLVSETLPFHIRGRGLAMAVSLNWLVNFAVTASFPFFYHSLNPALIYWIFAACAIGGACFIYLYVIETKGQSLERIEELTSSDYCPSIAKASFGIEGGDVDIEISSRRSSQLFNDADRGPSPVVSPSLRAEAVRPTSYYQESPLRHVSNVLADEEETGFRETPLSPPTQAPPSPDVDPFVPRHSLR